MTYNNQVAKLSNLSTILDRRLVCYVGLAVVALVSTVRRDSGDVTILGRSSDGEFELTPEVSARRSDWHLLATARTLIDIVAEHVATTSSSTPESRDAEIERGAKRLLDAAGSDDAALAGLRRLAGVLKHYRDHVISKQTETANNDVSNQPEVISEKRALLVENIRKMLNQAESADDNQRSAKDQETLSLHEDDGNLTSWKRFQNGISARRLYDLNDTLVDDVIVDLTHLTINGVVRPPDFWLGYLSQNKVVLDFEDLGRAIFRPSRGTFYEDDVSPDVYYFLQKDRAHADIAAFHIDRIMGFGRAPPVAWSLLNVTQDIEMSSQAGYMEFTVSPLGNKCYSYECTYNGHQNPVCADGHLLNGSFTTFLPTVGKAKLESIEDPWQHIRSVHEPKARWQRSKFQKSYCDATRRTPPFDVQSKLLDVIDTHIFDFIIGNMDRRHLYSYSAAFGNKSAFIHLNSPKGFGKARTDDIDILAPLYQCCQVRFSTLRRLLELANSPRGQKLGDRLKRSMEAWPLNPTVPQKHLDALDRRLWIVLEHVDACRQQAQEKEELDEEKASNRLQTNASIVIDDGF